MAGASASFFRRKVESAINSLKLKVPTAGLLHRLGSGHHSIDHIAVPSEWEVQSKDRVPATGLSDHDAYVIEAKAEAQRNE
jgi:hypothetical protein